MKTRFVFSLVALIVTVFAFSSCQMGADPWKNNQLMEPAELARILNDPAATKPAVFSIGFEADIKGSVEIGPVKDDANLQKFKDALSKLPKNANIVIYCGCCPFTHCPNVRPAFKLLNEMGFTNHKLLNLSNNIKADWIDKGYPINQ